MRCALLILLGAIGCASPSDPVEVSPLEEIWVCHNPQSDLHGTPCREKIDVIRGKHIPCFYVEHERVEDSFCWLLEKKDCTGELNMAWQRKNCHLLGVKENVEVHCGID